MCNSVFLMAQLLADTCQPASSEASSLSGFSPLTCQVCMAQTQPKISASSSERQQGFLLIVRHPKKGLLTTWCLMSHRLYWGNYKGKLFKYIYFCILFPHFIFKTGRYMFLLRIYWINIFYVMNGWHISLVSTGEWARSCSNVKLNN